MHKTAPPFSNSGGIVSVAVLEFHIQGWLLYGQLRQWSDRTLDNRRRLLGKFLWFPKTKGIGAGGRTEVRAFLACAGSVHLGSEGRWGNPRQRQPVWPSTVQTYCNILRASFSFLVSERALDTSPMAALKPLPVRADQDQPFTRQHVQALLIQARRTTPPRRD